jgi:hypothetical protein
VKEFTLLTDASDPAVERAVARLDDWAVERVESADLADAVGAWPGLRAIVVTSDDPSILRGVIDRAHSRTIPVVVACADDVARRRAVELRAEEWDRCPADPEEIEPPTAPNASNTSRCCTTRSPACRRCR